MKGKDKDNDIDEAMKHLLDCSLELASEMYAETLRKQEQQIISLKNKVHMANKYIIALQDWVRQKGEDHDICTYEILKKEVCSTCNCKRKPKGE